MPILKNRPPKYQRSGKYAGIYDHSQLEVMKELARNRRNPFETEGIVK